MTFSAMPDTARSGDTSAIVLKKPEGQGTKGSYYITGGDGVYPKAAAGINLNHRSRFLNVYGSCSYAFDKSYSLITARDTFQFPIDAARGVRTNNFYKEYTPTKNSLNASLSLNYLPDKNTLVGISSSLGGNFSRLQGYTKSDYNIYGDSMLLLSANNDGRENLLNIDNEINVFKILSTNKAMIVNAAYIRHWDHNSLTDQNTFLNKEGGDVSDASAGFYPLQNTLTITGIDILGAKVAYRQKLDSTLYLLGGLGFSDSKLSNTVDAAGLKNGTWVNDDSLSGRVTLREPIETMYTSLQFDKGRYGFRLGLTYEYITRDLHDIDSAGIFSNRYNQFLPSVAVWKKLSRVTRLDVGYDRRFALPAYSDIAQNVSFNDIYGVSIGNPFLQPVVSDNINAQLQYKDFQFSVFGRRDKRAIVTDQQSESLTGEIFYIMSHNLAYSESVSAEANLPFQLTSRLRWSNDLVGSWNQFQTQVMPSENFVTAIFQKSYFGYNLNSTVDLMLPHQYHIEVSGIYHSAGWSGAYNWTGAGALSLVASKSFADNSSLQLSMSDIFKSMYTHIYMNVPDLAYHIHSNFDQIPESRRAEVVRISYHKSFGSPKIRDPRNWESSAGDDLSRLR
jgi:hypothetical protein